jgi:hypothetical protein
MFGQFQPEVCDEVNQWVLFQSEGEQSSGKPNKPVHLPHEMKDKSGKSKDKNRFESFYSLEHDVSCLK